jgi:hypothetical protein
VAPRRVGAHSVSFISFSLRFLRQRKAAKEVWYLKIVPLTIDIKTSLTLFSLEQEPQRKKLCKKETAYTGLRAPYPRHCAWGTTFKKVDETIAWVQCEHPDK